MSRSPYGERGLKFVREHGHVKFDRSLSLRRAWIEICETVRAWPVPIVALLTESVD